MIDWNTASKSAVALPLGALASALGGCIYPAAIFAAAALVDWITGSLKAIKSGSWASAVAREGLWHKTGEFISLLVAAGMDLLLVHLAQGADVSYSPCLLPLVCVWYTCTELGSIIENVGELGAPVPNFLRRAIKLLQAKAESQGDTTEVTLKK